MQMFITAAKLDWDGWLRGVIGALISGGAGSIASGFAVTIADPAHDVSILKVIAFTFLISGVVSMAKFLQTTPVPNVVTVEVKNTTTLTQTQTTQMKTDPQDKEK